MIKTTRILTSDEWRDQMMQAERQGVRYEPETERRARHAKYWAWARNSFVILFAFTLGYCADEYRHSGIQYPTYEYKNVKVLKQFSRTEWLMEIDGQRIRWNACPDYPAHSVIWPGYVMSSFRYEDRGECRSLLNPNAHPPLGPVWRLYKGTKDVVEVDENGIVKETK